MIVDKVGRNTVVVRYRDAETLERKEEKLKCLPYGFIESNKAEFVQCIKKEEGFKGLFGEELTKCTFSDPYDLKDLKERFDKTWECNIPFTNRALVESGKTFPMYNHRVWYLDFEWIPDKDDELNVMSVFDNYMNKMLTWYVDPKATHKGFVVKDKV